MWSVTLHPSYVQCEMVVPRGIKVVRVYDSDPAQIRFMSFMWDEIEHIEIPLSITLAELMKIGMLALDARKE